MYRGPSGLSVLEMSTGEVTWRIGVAAREALAEYKGQDVALLTNRGLFLAELGRLEEALAAYERAIRLNPNDADAYYNQGNVLQELG